MAQIYINGPAIAYLRGCSRMVANDLMRAGRFGQLTQRGRVLYAALDAVERHLGHSIHPDQLEYAAAGKPGRVIQIKEPNEET